MKKISILIILVSFVLLSCTKKTAIRSNITNTNSNLVSFVMCNDTLIKRLNGKIIRKYIVAKEMKDQLNDFPQIINQFANDEYSSIDSAQILGDSPKNLYKTRIGKRGGDVVVRHIIMSNDNVVWNDSLVIDNSFSYYLTNDLFNQLKPYSGMYIAYKYFKDFVEKPLDSTSHIFVYGKLNVLGNMKSKSDSAYWKTYLANFKGRLIINLSDVDHDWLIWDKRQEKFIHFYEP